MLQDNIYLPNKRKGTVHKGKIDNSVWLTQKKNYFSFCMNSLMPLLH